MTEFKTFPAKILLFGEHIINKGANGLALPFHKCNCTLSFNKDETTLKESKEVLELIANQIEKDEVIENLFDVVNLHQDISNGLNINMNIPVGYGLGSSGAICAGIYETYCHSKKENPKKVKNILGRVESAFHGKSSGLDPLVSFLDKAVLVSSEKTEIIDFSLENITDFKMFLVDTNQARKTAPLVDKFLTKYNTKQSFADKINLELKPLTNEIIDDFISLKTKDTYKKIEKLSRLQLENFDGLILEEHKSTWKKGLNNEDFFLKICGAGGGGFMLGFCKDETKIIEAFSEEEILFL